MHRPVLTTFRGSFARVVDRDMLREVIREELKSNVLCYFVSHYTSNTDTPPLAMNIKQEIYDIQGGPKNGTTLIFWATVCKTVRPMLSDRCLSCL